MVFRISTEVSTRRRSGRGEVDGKLLERDGGGGLGGRNVIGYRRDLRCCSLLPFFRNSVVQCIRSLAVVRIRHRRVAPETVAAVILRVELGDLGLEHLLFDSLSFPPPTALVHVGILKINDETDR